MGGSPQHDSLSEEPEQTPTLTSAKPRRQAAKPSATPRIPATAPPRGKLPSWLAGATALIPGPKTGPGRGSREIWGQPFLSFSLFFFSLHTSLKEVVSLIFPWPELLFYLSLWRRLCNWVSLRVSLLGLLNHDAAQGDKYLFVMGIWFLFVWVTKRLADFLPYPGRSPIGNESDCIGWASLP